MVAFGNQQLTATQIDAIAGYRNSRTATGEQRYVSTCSGCHGNDGRGGRVGEGVRGESANSITEAIRDERSMQLLGCLSPSDVQLTATFLSSGEAGNGGSGGGGGGGGGGGSTSGTTLLGLLGLGLYRGWRPRRVCLC
jgi:mono/diheme cytochrome c family protein